MGRQILFIGIGQTGCSIAEMFSQKMSKDGVFVRSIAFDTDEIALSKLNMSLAAPMIDAGGLGKVAETLGEEKLIDKFPCDWEKDCSEFIKGMDMKRGSNGWRMKALLSFYSYLSKEEPMARLHETLNEFNEEAEIYVSASLAGGTGSGLLLPITFYIKRYLESIGANVILTHAALVMPNVFENSLSAEQRVKSYANAYTALRELNAVNKVALSAQKVDLSLIDFKLGLEDELYNAKDESFAKADKAPFDKVYLFERVSGVFSVEAHIDIISETVASFVRSRNFEEQSPVNKNMSIFGGVSLTKVKYPSEAIVDYITKKQLYSFISKELCFINNAVAGEINRQFAARRAYGGKTPELLPLFCETYTSIAEGVMETCEISEPLIGRNYEEDNDPNARTLTGASENVSKLTEAVYRSFEDDTKKELYKNIEALVLSPEQIKKEKINEKKHFYETYGEIKSLFNDYFLSGMEKLRENDSFADELLSRAEGFSIENEVMSEGGKLIHPAYALYKLCELYSSLQAYMKAQKTLSSLPEDADTVPDYILCVEEIKRPSGLYEQAGEERVALVLRPETEMPVFEIPKYESKKAKAKRKAEIKRIAEIIKYEKSIKKALFDNRSVFRDDVKAVAEKLTQSFAVLRINAVLQRIGEAVERYRELMRSVCNYREDAETDVKLLSLVGSVDSGNNVNIGASVEDKERIFQSYSSDFCKSPELPCELDCKIARIFASEVFSKGERSSAPEVCRKVEKIFKDTLLGSEFYRKEIDINIFGAIKSAVGSKNSLTDICAAKIFAGRNVPLLLSSPEAPEDRMAIKRYTAALLPLSVKKDVEESAGGKESPEKFIEKLMYNAGEYSGRAYFSEGISDKEMYLRKEESSLPLYMIEAVNEGGDHSVGYASYKKALRVARAQNTIMWDPRLVYNRGFAPSLPFISPRVQEEYRKNAAKAVIYAFMKDIITLSPYGNEKAYFIDNGRETIPLCINEDEPITEDKIELVMLYAYGNSEWTYKYAARADEEMRNARANYPPFNSNLLNYGLIAYRINKSPVFTSFYLSVARLLKLLYSSERLDMSSHAGYIARTASSYLLDFCLGKSRMFDEISSGIYNRMLNSFNKQLAEACTIEKAQEILDILGGFDCFRRYVFIEGFTKNIISDADIDAPEETLIPEGAEEEAI